MLQLLPHIQKVKSQKNKNKKTELFISFHFGRVECISYCLHCKYSCWIPDRFENNSLQPLAPVSAAYVNRGVNCVPR